MLLAALAATGACAGGGDDDGPASGEEASGDDEAGGSGSDDHTHDEEPAAGFEESEATTKVAPILRDYAFVGIPATVRGPNVLFTATIRGANTHELEIVDAGGDPAGAIAPFEASEGEHTLAVVLEPGTYTVQCLVKEGTRTHAQLGMRQALSVE